VIAFITPAAPLVTKLPASHLEVHFAFMGARLFVPGTVEVPRKFPAGESNPVGKLSALKVSCELPGGNARPDRLAVAGHKVLWQYFKCTLLLTKGTVTPPGPQLLDSCKLAPG